MAAVNPEALEQVIRRELRARDAARRARLFDQTAYEAADAAFVVKVMEAAGFPAPEAAGKAVRRGRRAAAKNEAAAFGDVA
ncbi:MAG TPA: hypothetical protein VF070_13215 [Streptosporangiaceae bacterium]